VRIERDLKLDYADVLFRPKRSTIHSRSFVDLTRDYTFRWGNRNRYSGVPIMAANMDGVGTFNMHAKLTYASFRSAANMFTCLVKSYTLEDYDKNFYDPRHCAISTGITEEDLTKTFEILNKHTTLKYLCVDVANGYSEKFLNVVETIRTKYPKLVIIAGNVVTPDVTEELILRGADIVKVGIGPGSVCTTRIKTGVGYPQLSAVIECADAAHGLGGHIIADGGCVCPGDVSKAFGAGADFVMLGGMLAGTDQGGGQLVDNLGNPLKDSFGKVTNNPRSATKKAYVQFYGMSSNAAQEKHGGRKEYRASEGRIVRIPYRGDVDPIMGDILGGLRSTCTYVGAKTLKELSKRTTFVQVNNARQYNNVFESYSAE